MTFFWRRLESKGLAYKIHLWNIVIFSIFHFHLWEILKSIKENLFSYRKIVIKML